MTNPLVKAWSYSRYADYTRCPNSFRLKHIAKVPEGPPGKALLHGQQADEALTAYVTGAARTVPKTVLPDLRELTAPLRELRRTKVHAQLELSVRIDWSPTAWKDWDEAWLRAKLDIGYVEDSPVGRRLVVIDFKTGKIRPEEHAEQLELYAAVGLAHFQDVVEVQGEMWYVDHGIRSDPAVFTVPAIMKLRKKWEKTSRPMFADRLFKPRPGVHCGWCAYSKKNKGGPCAAG